MAFVTMEHLQAKRRVAELERLLDEARERVVWGFYLDGKPSFTQGKAGEHELTEPVTAEQMNRLVGILYTLGLDRESEAMAFPAKLLSAEAKS